jgi:hypothetical protein
MKAVKMTRSDTVRAIPLPEIPQKEIIFGWIYFPLGIANT